MSSEINKISSGSQSLDPKVFEKNLQHLGRQTDSIQKKDTDQLASARDTLDLHDRFREKDTVDLSRDGQKAAEQTGQLQEMGRDKKVEKKKAAQETEKSDKAKTDQKLDSIKEAIKDAGKATAAKETEISAPASSGAAAEAGAEISAGTTPASGTAAADETVKEAKGTEPAGKTPPGGTAGDGAASSGSATDAANKYKSTQEDIEGAQKIFMEMAASRQKWFTDIWKIFQDLQDYIMQTVQQVLINRAKVMDEISKAWGEVIRGDYK
ncbi:MAG: hypothetical protein M1269_01720 [Chloroflexi bacterium]|nr:hypothetical protein [Chloroflexota bacterium]